MEAPMPKSEEYIYAWVNVLDELTYYELFGVDNGAPADAVRAAFHSFCDVFHPDLHRGRSTDEREALSLIFKRCTEAYLVLSDEGLRGRYDRDLAVRPSERPPRISYAQASGPAPRLSNAPPKLEDLVRSPSARPFARRADELIRAGDHRQAKL